MQLLFECLLILSAVYYSSAQYELNPGPNLRAGPQPSFEADQIKADDRFIKTASWTLTTLTVTTVTTRVTTCTTSTAGLSVCTASGRRRRGLNLSGNKEGRGLFYNDQEEQSEDGSIFLPLPAETKEDEAVKSVAAEQAREVRMQAAEPVPFVVQPGFNAPAGQARVLLYFGTSTVTTTSTTTTTTSLTASCQSTTGYQLCGSTGK
ncbi:hypothetical protein DAPPUDRAFT_95314 [Daphnia pulex]|uniref:Uncharacterized protein n=1 Tax=Daphnia pulex TaxID=6669 RepID=E9FVB5_DAPPU|nr:hypothetical protein DAPPUDRAFT_95314 [Daphnia pulex]|eukprot:EFX89140.1 hypothetical protein DAPPUDRAFT_95314 [Daphnia pulex]